jgi:succinyl-CoA synthetase alpha subunit
MLFSDNVPLAEERAIKTVARDKGLLVMGPDCGTAIVNGVPLGFANVVRRGDIGLVAASGTGLQEVTCRIHNLGGGVSQALGTGGRDLKEDIGGITMLQGLSALAADAATRVIVLISKPPAPDIARRIEAAAAQAGKPVVVHFLGASARAVSAPLVAATSLRHAGDLAVALARADAKPSAAVEPAAAELARIDERCAAMASMQRAVRALFTGGTFCYEAQLAFNARALPCKSNAPTHDSLPFDGRYDGHVFLDLGDDDYTRGRPHPMIDPSVRDALVRAQGADAQVAMILFDVVLGYGSHADPSASLAAALCDAQAQARAQGRTLLAIGHVCGTDGDPQDKATQVRQLQDAGALIVGSNIEAALLAAHGASRCATRR